MAKFTDRYLKSLKPVKGERYDRWERDGFGVRVASEGRISFVLMARYPGSSNPTRRTLGTYPGLTLAKAREKAEEWRKLVGRRIDPSVEEERQRQAEDRKRENSFTKVAEDFIAEKLPGERKGEEVERDVRRVLIPAWGKRPISDITPLDVVTLIKGFRETPYQAHNLLGYTRRLFNWAINQHAYGIETSPCDRLKPRDIIGEKVARTRTLTDAELKAAWHAAGKVGYPYGPLFALLILTGQRKSEVAEAHRGEVDLEKKLWTIPAERMKADAAHVVPLSDDAVAVIKELPEFKKGDYLFSTTFGKKPVNGFSKAKATFDGKMLECLKEQDPKAKLPPFVIHDLRRTVRTRLSTIPNVSDLVRELVIGHTKPELHKVYDQYAYLDEKRFALDSWATKLRGIVSPTPTNVVRLADGVGAKLAELIPGFSGRA